MADWLWHWRQRVADGLHCVPGFLFITPSGSKAHFVGERPGVETRWKIDRRLYLQGDYGVLCAGPFIRQSESADALMYRSRWLGYKF